MNAAAARGHPCLRTPPARTAHLSSLGRDRNGAKIGAEAPG
jgi:hypothetical protein